MPSPDLSIIIPMYNESQVIGPVLNSLLTLFATKLSPLTFEIIVVDDGSSDDSAAQLFNYNNTHTTLATMQQ
jgi:glycosyltransferase involved in cell wall biosynthesis